MTTLPFGKPGESSRARIDSAAAGAGDASSAGRSSKPSGSGPGTHASIPCTHCHDPVPRGLIVQGAAKQFCCQGCRAAHEIISSCGLERFYALRDAESLESGLAAIEDSPEDPRSTRESRALRRDYAEFDDPAFTARHVFRRADGAAACDLFLEGVHCAACLWLLERLPRVVPGVLEARLDLRRSLLRVTWDPARTCLSQAARALHRLGYPPHPARAAAARRARSREERRQLVNIGIAAACAMNVMLLALAMYAGLFDTIEAAHLALFRWTSMALSVVAVAGPGRVFFRGAFAALRTRSMQLDLPIAVGLGAGLIWGVVNTLRGSGEIYFDSLSVLVFALLVGRYIQQRQQRWSADAVELLFSLTPTRADRVEQGPAGEVVRTVPLEAVAIDDLLHVGPGETIPADGVVESGASRINRSLLTGESTPVEVEPGDSVPAGAANLSSPLRLRVKATGESTRVGRLMRLVGDAASERAPIVRLTDRIAGWFVVGALGLATLTAMLWWPSGPEIAIEHAVALLIVTCPCGLGLATPLAISVAMGRAARMGILIKGGEALERLAHARRQGRRGVVYLDKTGTITEGRLGVVDHIGDLQAVRMAAAAERDVAHPVAEALRRSVAAQHASDGLGSETVLDSMSIADQHHVLGGGVTALVDGERIVVGSIAFVTAAIDRERTARPNHADLRLLEWARDAGGRGVSPVLVAREGRLAAAVALGDRIRSDAADAVAVIQRMGWMVGVLSGDDPKTVRSVLEQVGLPSRSTGREGALLLGGQTPEDKLDVIRGAVLDGPTIMVGDGVNDAAALAAATVGVAVHGGAEASLLAADVHLGRPGLRGVVELLAGSRRAIAAVHRNIAVSLAYNAVAAGLCVAGMISPLLAAVIMPVSSLSIVALSLRARTFAPDTNRRRSP